MAGTAEPGEVATLIDKINGFKTTAENILNNEAARAELLQASRRLTAVLERPEEVPRIIHMRPIHATCVRVAVDLKLFNIIAEESQSKGNSVTASRLAEMSGAEELLIVRLMRVLVALGLASELDTEKYGATPATMVMAKPWSQAGAIHMSDQMMIPLAKLPEYLKKTGYRCPKDSRSGPLQYAFDTDTPIFDLFASQSGVMENFNTFMTGVRGGRQSWVDWFPIEKQLLDDAADDEGAACMVDVGGGHGHNVIEVRDRFPSVPGRFIVQDLPSVIEEVGDSDARIETMGMNMFNPQPVKGARFYFFHFICHDWANDECRLFLQNTAAAMKPGYSKLILGEYILPDKGCPLAPAEGDLAMLTMHSGMERSERQWRELLDSAGLQVVGFWHPPGKGDGIIEAELKT